MVVVRDASENFLILFSLAFLIAQMPLANSSNLKRVRKLGIDESGQATVEFALVLPFLFLFSLSVVQVGSVANDQLALGHASRTAARAISLWDVTDESANQIALNSVQNSVMLNPIDVDIKLSENTAKVTLSYRRHINIPIIGNLFNALTLQATTTMPREVQTEKLGTS